VELGGENNSTILDDFLVILDALWAIVDTILHRVQSIEDHQKVIEDTCF